MRIASAIAAAAIIATLSRGQKAPRPEFEVVSVKANTNDGPFDLTPHRSGDRVYMHNTQIGPMVVYAYKVPRGFPMEGDFRLPPGWNWLDIDAKAPEATSDDDIRLMFQSMLEDRFKLKVHHVTRELPVYSLTQTKKGPKLKQWTEDAPPFQIIGRVAQDGVVANYSSREDPHHIVGRKASMARLAAYLTTALQSTVTDNTGLAGDYNFELTWDSDEPPLAPPDPGLVDALLQEQLGLKLEKSKAPVEIWVVDHVEKPSGN